MITEFGQVPISKLMSSIGHSRSSWYRHRKQQGLGPSPRRPKRTGGTLRALSDGEKSEVFALLCNDRFVDRSPAFVFYTLADEGIYLCSVRTMYRILKVNHACSERRRFRRSRTYARPELLATGVNQIWSWDITRLKGPVPHKHFYLYVIIDIFSRAVVGWLVAETECALIAKLLIQATMARFGITPFSGLVLHSDRGPQMTSKEVGQLLAELGVLKSFSRPRTSNDNPFSEAQFKTLKYSATYPDRFGLLQHARTWCLEFMNWYNQEHKHSGIGYYTPLSVQDGSYQTLQNQRSEALSRAAARFPERFNKQPVAPELPKAVWINPPIPTPSLGVSEMH